MINVPPDVSSDAVATAPAFPVALVSDVIAAAVAVPLFDAPKGFGVVKGSVATIAPGEPIVPVRRKCRFALVAVPYSFEMCRPLLYAEGEGLIYICYHAIHPIHSNREILLKYVLPRHSATCKPHKFR